MADRGEKVFLHTGPAEVLAGEVSLALVHGCGGKIRLVGEYNGYTYPSPDTVSGKTLLTQEGGGQPGHFCRLHSMLQFLQAVIA